MHQCDIVPIFGNEHLSFSGFLLLFFYSTFFSDEKWFCWNIFHSIFHYFKSKITHSLFCNKLICLFYSVGIGSSPNRINYIIQIDRKRLRWRWRWLFEMDLVLIKYSVFDAFVFFPILEQSDRTKEKVRTKIFTMKNRKKKKQHPKDSAIQCDLI